MIYTVTFNPSLDYIVRVNNFRPGVINRTFYEKILPGGTGYITDAGMTGAYDSVLGMKTETSMTRLVSKMSARYEPATGPAVICGIVFNTDVSGRCLEIRRFCEYE